MIKLIEINENNWLKATSLKVRDDQRGFLDRSIGIIARGYAYRNYNPKVIGITNDETLVGLALVKDMDEEPACYDLQQFMIDERYQNKGYGTKALKMILSELEKEGKYNCAEVCVKMADTAAIHVYEKTGFVDTGYIDDELPDCLNLMYYFKK